MQLEIDRVKSIPAASTDARILTLDKFWNRVDRRINGCWYWIGALTTDGYGQIKTRGAYLMVHRVAYALLVGPIPQGLQLDHTCRNRSCVNPEHLEPVSQRENILRGVGIPSQNAQKTHCRNGHEYTPENTARNRVTGRQCLKCLRKSQREYATSKRAESKGSFK